MNVVVIGLGRFGSNLATTLTSLGHDVLGIDLSERATQELADEIPQVVQADATDEATLRELGIADCEVAFVAMADIQVSIMTTMLLKQLGVARIHAKARNSLHGQILERIGCDQVVFPEREMAVRVAHNLAAPDLVEYFELIAGYGVGQVNAPTSFSGKSLASLNLRSKLDISVLVIKRNTKLIVMPDLKEVVEDGDVLILVGKDSSIESLDSVV